MCTYCMYSCTCCVHIYRLFKWWCAVNMLATVYRLVVVLFAGSEMGDLNRLKRDFAVLQDELVQCKADREFVWSLWKRLQVANPDVTQAISIALQKWACNDLFKLVVSTDPDRFNFNVDGADILKNRALIEVDETWHRKYLSSTWCECNGLKTLSYRRMWKCLV